MPGVISSLFFIIVGAIARYAYSDTVWSWTSGGSSHSLKVDTIGLILMIAGLVALLLSILWAFLSKRAYVEEEREVMVEEVYEPPTKVKRTRKPSVKVTETTDEPLVNIKKNTRRKSV